MFLPDLNVENDLWSKGYSNIVGIDEVGRGAWAGPLVAAGVILPHNFKIPTGFADSKQLSAKSRAKFDNFIRSKAQAIAIAEISHEIINKIGIGHTTQMAFRKIIKTLPISPDFILIDAFQIKYVAKSIQKPIKHGDRISVSIAAASIIAKVYRDKLMVNLAKIYEYYGFDKHKGYGTKMHQEAIQKYGFCKIHRTNYNLKFLSS